jgi:menaquinone-dependent protoporphyrinogen oxidase
MSRLLILYGTTNGHTRKIAQVLGETLGEEGFSCDVIDAERIPRELDVTAYDGVLVAASIHARGYPRAVARWVQSHADQLNLVPSAFVSVCLGILERRPEAQTEVRAIMNRFFEASGWQPAATKTVAGALLYSQYDWLTRWFMKRIVAKAGGDTDTSRDYEYTDWDDLRAFARAFARKTMTIGQSIGALP